MPPCVILWIFLVSVFFFFLLLQLLSFYIIKNIFKFLLMHCLWPFYFVKKRKKQCFIFCFYQISVLSTFVMNLFFFQIYNTDYIFVHCIYVCMLRSSVIILLWQITCSDCGLYIRIFFTQKDKNQNRLLVLFSDVYVAQD